MYTKGKWEVSKMYDDGSVHIHGGANQEYVCSVQIEQIGGGAIAEVMEEGRLANARLIAEAGTIANKTGFTPKQLAEQKADLLEACKLAREALKDHVQYDDGESLERDGFNATNAAITKAEQK